MQNVQDKSTIKMLTINEAAERIPGLTKYRIREMCIKGQLPCVKAGRKYLICEQVLIRFLTEPHQTEISQDTGKIRRINA